MPLPDAEYQRFLSLIDPSADKQEVECARYLQFATTRLFPSYPSVDFSVEFEERRHFGRSDFMVIGEFKSDIGRMERRIYFWEVKAAQCFLVKRDDADVRVRPTTDLIKAETQLIHYVSEARGSEEFRDRFGVRPSGIRFGGIIIGRDSQIWDRSDTRLKERDVMYSYRLRLESLYEHADIRVLTWDRVEEILKPTSDTMA